MENHLHFSPSLKDVYKAEMWFGSPLEIIYLPLYYLFPNYIYLEKEQWCHHSGLHWDQIKFFSILLVLLCCHIDPSHKFDVNLM